MLLLAVSSGCQGTGTKGPTVTLPSVGRVSNDPKHYRRVVGHYNQNLSRVDRLWARAVVELKWQDNEGSHFEQGEGNLILVLPDRVALSVGKLGHTLLWAGCDAQQYWLFDLRDQKTVYVGSHDDVATGEAGALPIPIRPLDLMHLLGITRIDTSRLPASPMIEWIDGHMLIEPPGAQWRVLIDPQTHRPVRIDLLDQDGHSRATGRLSRWKRMTIDGTHPGAYPWVATRLEVSLVERPGTMTLFLSAPTDGRAEGRIKNQAFELPRLIKAFKPSRRIDLRPNRNPSDRDKP